jgi:hypothetical protein
VLSAPARDVDEAWNVVAWAADHATELGADAEMLHLAGNSSMCEAVREIARGTGWPPISGDDGMLSTRQERARDDLSRRAVD